MNGNYSTNREWKKLGSKIRKQEKTLQYPLITKKKIKQVKKNRLSFKRKLKKQKSDD